MLNLAIMKKIRHFFALILVLIVFIESSGFNMINYCTGYFRVIPALSGMDIRSDMKCLDDCLMHEVEVQCSCCSGCCNDHHESYLSLCSDEDHRSPGFHVHHDDESCIQTSFFQLNPLQKTLSYCLPIFISDVIYTIDACFFEKEKHNAFAHIPYIPHEYGRCLLSKISVLLI